MCEDQTNSKPMHYEWSKSYPALPKDHLQSHRYLHAKQFVPSYDSPCAPVANMFCLLGWEYSRIWHCELAKFVEKRKTVEVIQFIKPDVNFNRNRFAKMSRKPSMKQVQRVKNKQMK